MATIEIQTNDARIQYADHAVTANVTQLPIDFPFFELDDIKVIRTNSAGVDTVLSRGTGTNKFAVTGVAVDDGFSSGNVTLSDSNDNTFTYTIYRELDIARANSADFPTSGPFNISSLNTSLDKIYALAQQLDTENNRSLTMPKSDGLTSITLPTQDSRKGKYLAFNSSTGAAEVGGNVADTGTVASQSANITTVAGQISPTNNIATVAGIAANITTVAGDTTQINALGQTSVINDMAALTASGVIADMAALGDSAVIADMAALGEADVIADMAALNTTAVLDDMDKLGTTANVTAMGNLGTSANVTNMATLTASGVVANIATVAGISSNVTSVAGNNSNITAVAGNSTNINAVAGNATNINTVASANSNITTLANISSDITSVAGIASDVAAVENKLTEIQAVADDLAETSSEIDLVAGSIANVNTVGTNIANVNTVAGANSNISALNASGVIANIGTVAGAVTNVNTVATNISNVNSVGGISSNVTTVAGVSSNVTTVAGIASDVSTVAGANSNISTVASGISNINSVASNSTNINAVAGNATNINAVNSNASNINTVAGANSNISTVASNISGVNSFAERYRVGSSDPGSSNDAGDLFFNTSSNDLKVYNGSSYGSVALTSGTVAKVTVTDSTANTDFPVVFHDESNGLLDDTGALRYNPSTGVLLVPNITVSGTTTTVNTTNTTVSDNLLELNSGASSNSNDVGIIMQRGSTGDDALFMWDESADKFALGTTTDNASSTGNLNMTTGTLVANLEGNVTGNADTASAVAADNISTGDAAINLTTTTGDITIDAQGSDTDIIFKGMDGSSPITMLTLDGSDNGDATFKGKIISPNGIESQSYFWQKTDGNVSLYGGANYEIALTHVHNTGFKLTNGGTGTPAVELQFVDSNEAIGSDGTNLILTSGGNEITVPNVAGTVLTTGNSATPTTTTSSSDADFVLIDDGGTMKKITPSNLGIGGVTSTFSDDITAKTSDGAILKLQTSDTIVDNNDVVGAIEFSAPDEANGGDAHLTAAAIVAEADASFKSSVNKTDLVFKLGASESATEKMRLEWEGNLKIGGAILPTTDDTYDLGSSSYQWRDIYTGDINLNNTKTRDNEVDGTRGSWTIQEGSDDLFLLNRLNGKKYKFKLEEMK